MARPNGLNELRERLEDKLGYTRRLIAEYEETMDYASHCNLLGFAEGIEFVMEEIVEVLKRKGGGRQETTKSRTEGKGASSKGKVTGNKQKKPGTGKREARGKPRSKDGKRVTG